MKRLAPDLFDRRFDDLMKIGRAKLPALAREWTDHNAHDPGITLLELLAWVAEAQIYSLARMRRDERTAYAALLGLRPDGAQAAAGLIWPDHGDSRAPLVTYAQSLVIAADAVVNVLDSETPTFRPAAKLLWIPGRVRQLTALLADGSVVDYTVRNQRGSCAFEPFGAFAGRNDVLRMEFECRSADGVFPEKRSDADGALWPIGVRAAPSLTVAGASSSTESATTDTARPTAVSATLVVDSERFPLRVVSDSSKGLLTTGVLLLDLSNVVESPQRFTLELQARSGFDRPPRLLRIEPNVLPIVQGRPVTNEIHVATGAPDWTFQLDVAGLRFAPSAQPIQIEEIEARTERRRAWRPARLTESGPSDAVYEFDPDARRVTFGNGVNGQVPAADARMAVTYAVCDGKEGNVAANRKWRVTGFLGSFGVNPDAVTGGASPESWIDRRRKARSRVRDEHALVSASDIVSAALDLPLLEVARAWVLTPGEKTPRAGAVHLMAMRARLSEEAAGDAPETRRWLDAIRRALMPQMLLGARLVVVGPRYVEFTLRASIEALAGRDPQVVRRNVEQELRKRLALVGATARQPGVPVSARDVTAWIRSVNGVQRVTSLRLTTTADVDEVKAPRDGLPRLDLAGSQIDVQRGGSGGRS
jgi:predicted phage baseplate assembly protein